MTSGEQQAERNFWEVLRSHYGREATEEERRRSQRADLRKDDTLLKKWGQDIRAKAQKTPAVMWSLLQVSSAYLCAT
jgi:hypothetical protein